MRATVCISGSQRLFFAVVDFKNLQETGQLQDFPRRRAQSKQNEPRTEVARRLQAFDERGDTGTVDVVNAGEVHDHARDATLTDLTEQGLTNLGGVCEIDVP